ncbi:AAA family ATPase [Myxococcota bacterium]|nr:AAA family ATPase [Myxococcota bacterium]MBU1897893.1 AAA family ATPase [Myxococcota bacterium]
MLTRFKVQGFKNLRDVDVRFGPLTCLAGVGGAGKSNLFDAIELLSRLVDMPFTEAAMGVRGGQGICGLFSDRLGESMCLYVEVLIPPEGRDAFGQRAEASNTHLAYTLRLARAQDDELGVPRVALVEEHLAFIKRGETEAQIGFPCAPAFLDSVALSSSRSTTFIHTEQTATGPVVWLQSDMNRAGRSSGIRPVGFEADQLPRTVLSSASNANAYRTCVLLREELRGWRRLRLDPDTLRRPSELRSPNRLGASGAHLAATLHHLAARQPATLPRVVEHLNALIGGVEGLEIERDTARGLFSLHLTEVGGLTLDADALSDGLLRALALAALEVDPRGGGLICLEEIEDGAHPERVAALMSLLYRIAVDPERAVGADNPLRQILISTHSPIVIAQTAGADLLFVDQPPTATRPTARLRHTRGGWRGVEGGEVTPAQIARYLVAGFSEVVEGRVFADLGGQLRLTFNDSPHEAG